VSRWSSVGLVDVTTTSVVSVSVDAATRRPQISWTEIPGAQRYELWVNNTTTGQGRVIHESNLSSTSFSAAAGLEFGTYAVWVRAVNSFGQVGDWSEVVLFDIGPQLLTPTGSSFRVPTEFTWTTVPGVASFEIYIQVGATVIRQAGLTNPSYSPTTTLAAGTHLWWVRGVAANGRAGRWSAPAEFSVGGRPVIVTPISGSTTTTSPQFSWEAVEGASRYTVYVSLVSASNGDAATLEFRSDNVTTTSYTHAIALSNSNATYRVWVRAISGDGTLSAWSVPVTFAVAADSALEQSDDRIGINDWSLVNLKPSNDEVVADRLRAKHGQSPSPDRRIADEQTEAYYRYDSSNGENTVDAIHLLDAVMAASAVEGYDHLLCDLPSHVLRTSARHKENPSRLRQFGPPLYSLALSRLNAK